MGEENMGEGKSGIGCIDLVLIAGAVWLTTHLANCGDSCQGTRIEYQGNRIENKVNQLLQRNEGTELLEPKTEKIFGQEARFYEINGEKAYLSIDGQPIEERCGVQQQSPAYILTPEYVLPPEYIFPKSN